MKTVTISRVFAAAVLAVAASTLVVGLISDVQAGQVILDHYKVYELDPTLTVMGEPVILRDQFDGYDAIVDGPFRLGVPTSKNESGIIRRELHYTWYKVNAGEQPLRKVAYENQFGENAVTVRQPSWLLSPALKNSTDGDIQFADHFLCYDAAGADLLFTSLLQNQFGEEQVVLLDPKLFCNPVEKTHREIVYPIYNEVDHLVCYDFEPHGGFVPDVGLVDQFVQTQGAPYESVLLCVPSIKTGVVPTNESTWGRMKSLYR